MKKAIISTILGMLLVGGISLGATILFPSGGGTGIGTYGRGDLIMATSSSQLMRLATSTEGYVLTITSGIPAWAISTGGITSLNGLTAATQTFASTSETNLGITITSSGSVHTFAPYWIGTLADGRIASAATWNAKQNALSFPLAYASTTHITATIPLTISSGVISMPTSTDSQSGYLSSADWTTFNNKGSGTVTSVGMTTPTGLTISGSPITTSGTLALSLTSGYVIPLTASTTNWNTAYADRLKWDGGATDLVAATGRTSLELGSMALLANTGSTTITTLGTIATGVWNGTSIADAKIDDNITVSNYLLLTGGTISGTLTVSGTSTLATTTITNLTVSGAITLSGLKSGFLKVDVNGLVSTSTIDISSDTNLAAGRSLTMSGDSVEADIELFTWTKCILIETPADADDLLFFRTNNAITVTDIDCISENATSTVVVIVECDADGNNCGSANNRVEESLTCAVTNTADDGTIGNAGAAAGAWFRAQVGTVTGTPGHTTVCITATMDD